MVYRARQRTGQVDAYHSLKTQRRGVFQHVAKPRHTQALPVVPSTARWAPGKAGRVDARHFGTSPYRMESARIAPTVQEVRMGSNGRSIGSNVWGQMYLKVSCDTSM